ncbi:MAG: AcrR family transcriptional regulator [Cognaticolwellia sp.]|jgi:AcrR family transcriptional regulator
MAGRPPGRSEKGAQMEAHLYSTAMASFAEQGFEISMRQLAQSAGVSPGLLYRYFPSKHALVLRLYTELSQDFAEQKLAPGTWTARAQQATALSLATLQPHRELLQALLGVLVGVGEDSLFGANTTTARNSVISVFDRAITESSGQLRDPKATALLAYFLHMGVLLFWLLDKSPEQRATATLEALIPWRGLGLALKLPGSGALVQGLAGCLQRGLLGQ